MIEGTTILEHQHTGSFTGGNTPNYILIYEFPQQQDKNGVMLVRMRSKLLGGPIAYGGSGINLEDSFDSVRGLTAITQSFSLFAFILFQHGDISIGG